MRAGFAVLFLEIAAVCALSMGCGARDQAQSDGAADHPTSEQHGVPSGVNDPSDVAGDADPSPDFLLPGVGGDFRLSDHRGDVVVLNFWATWNEPSVEGMAALDRIHTALGADGIAVVGIAQDEGGVEVIREWLEGRSVSYPLVADHAQDVARRFGDIEMLPTTVIVDREGLIRTRHTGILTQDEVLDLLGPILIETDEPLSERPRPGTSGSLSPVEAHRLVEEGAMLVDVRPRREFVATGSALHAEHLPLHALAAQDLPANFGVPIVLLGSDDDSAQAADRCRRWGYSEVYMVEGGLDAWKNAGLPYRLAEPSRQDDQPLARTRPVIG